MNGDRNEPREPEWEKAYEIALALLCLSDSHRRDHRRRRPQFSSLFLESFEEEGWIEDSNTALGWIELTDTGWDRARALLEKHFGIVVHGG